MADVSLIGRALIFVHLLPLTLRLLLAIFRFTSQSLASYFWRRPVKNHVIVLGFALPIEPVIAYAIGTTACKSVYHNLPDSCCRPVGGVTDCYH